MVWGPLKKKECSIGPCLTFIFEQQRIPMGCLHRESHLDHRVVVLPQAIHVPMVGESERFSLLVITDHQALLAFPLDDC